MTSGIFHTMPLAAWILLLVALAAIVPWILRRRSGAQPATDTDAQDNGPDVDALARGEQPQGYKVGASISSGKATGYGYPGDPTGGGSIGYKGQKLRSTQDFFAGRSKYVSIALNPKFMNSLWPPGDHDFRNAPITFSPAIDQRYAKELQALRLKHVPLVAMDTGPGVVRQQMDVYVSSKEEAFSLPGSPEVNADILIRNDS